MKQEKDLKLMEILDIFERDGIYSINNPKTNEPLHVKCLDENEIRRIYRLSYEGKY